MPEQRRVGVVHVLLYAGPVSLPWRSRQGLLAEFRHLDSRQALLRRLPQTRGRRYSMPSSRSEPRGTVALTLEQKGESLEVIELWLTRVPYQDLPEGILELRAALADDLHDTAPR